MRRLVLLVTTALCPPAAFAATCDNVAPNYANTSGGFGALNGQIYQQYGTPFIAHGVNVMEGNQPSVSALQSAFPGVNFVRLAIYDYASPAALQSYVNSLTAAGIVVELEDHNNGAGNAGGSQGVIFTGQQLQTELAWYSAIGTAFKSNPYVWFGTNNEPSEINPSTGQMDAAALSTWQQQTYQAIRSTENNSPIMLEINGWADSSSFAQGYTPSVYASMTNVVGDIHDYGWLTNYSTDQATNSNFLAQAIATTQQRLPTADGTMPVIIGEYGNSTTGMSIDPNGNQVVTAVDNSGVGSAAWAWGTGNPGDGLTNGGNGLSSYGQQVAAYVASSAATGCAIVPAVVAPAPTPVTASATNDTANLSVAQVAALAASTVASAPASSSGTGGTLTTEQIAAIAAGPVANVTPIQRTAASPGGTMPTPDSVSNAASWSTSSNYGTVVPTAGNAMGAVSGTGNTINATGGIQTISVTGSGNTITTGSYNDVVTVQTAGNTINLGGGNDTLNLAYNGQTPSSVINADAAAIPPLASAGNVIVLPAPGTGVLTINGVMAANDRLDVTKALAGTTWDGSQSTVWNYVAAAATPQGCTISVGGQIIASLPNGSPGGQLGDFIVANR